MNAGAIGGNWFDLSANSRWRLRVMSKFRSNRRKPVDFFLFTMKPQKHAAVTGLENILWTLIL